VTVAARRRFPCTAGPFNVCRGGWRLILPVVSRSASRSAPEPSISRGFQRLSVPSTKPARCTATRERRFRARAVSGPSRWRAGFKRRHDPISGPQRGPVCDPRRAPKRRQTWPSAIDKAAFLPPTCSRRADAWCARLCCRPRPKANSRHCGAKAPRAALRQRDSVRRGAPGCVLAFPSPPNQVDRRVTRRRDTRSR